MESYALLSARNVQCAYGGGDTATFDFGRDLTKANPPRSSKASAMLNSKPTAN